MNINPSAKAVLCFGDSNTYGRTPNDENGRFNAQERWTGVLQSGLGDGYYVIEEGLGGRTTDLEYPDFEGRNGRKYLRPCLQSHYPLDIVIIMLGTNDFKTEFNRSAADIANAVGELVQDVSAFAADAGRKAPHAILVSPIHLNEAMAEFANKDKYGRSSVEKSLQLATALQKVAEKYGTRFFDAAQVAKAGEDGVHIDLAGHTALGEALTKLVLSG